MTVHIALANGQDAVLLSDSQGTAGEEEFHGWQKQFVGSDFLIGVAGNGMILERLFDTLESALATTPPSVDSGSLSEFLEEFFRDEVRASEAGTVELVLLTPGNGEAAIQQFDPGVFFRVGKREPSASIGSGSEFVQRVFTRNTQTGIDVPWTTPAEMLVFAMELAEAADESLTVDNFLTAGLLLGDRAYLMADVDVIVSRIPDILEQQWDTATQRWAHIRNAVTIIHGEMRSAHRVFSSIRTGALDTSDLQELRTINTSIGNNVAALSQQLADYCAWHDNLLGR